MMEISQLKYFLVVNEEQSYNKASKKLYISRQALRKNIQSLEEEIGAPLFLLQNNKLYLTLEGNRLLTDAKTVVEAYDSLIENNVLRTADAAPSLHIEIDYTMFPFMIELFMPKINAFAYNHPEIDFQIQEKTEEEIFQDLEYNSCDCAAVLLPSLDYPFLSNYTVINAVPGKPAIYILESKLEHYYAEYPYSNLKGQTIILPGTGETLFQKALISFLDEQKIDYKEIRLADTVESIAGEVRSGYGVSFFTYPGCKYFTTTLTTIHIPMEDSKLGFNLVLLLQKNKTPSLHLFEKYLRQEFSN